MSKPEKERPLTEIPLRVYKFAADVPAYSLFIGLAIGLTSAYFVWKGYKRFLGPQLYRYIVSRNIDAE